MPLRQTADELIPDLARWQRRLLTGGVIGALVSTLDLFFEPTQFFQSYLMAYMLCLGVTLGCLALGMVHQLSGGAWGVVARRPIGAAARVLPVMTLLFLPIVFGMRHLYPWTHADLVARDEVLQAKQLYLNIPFFLIRAAVYFIAWNAVSFFLNAWSLEQDRTDDPQIARRMQRLSAGGLVAYGLTITFASFDWLMSLEPHWFSTIYGVLIIGGQGLTGLAFLIIVLVWLGRRPPLDRIIVPAHFHDLGNLLLAFVMLWAYFSFSQYLITWAGNLPEEIAWYLHRQHTSWRIVGAGLVLFHFAVPFALLLSRTVKREPQMIVKVAIGIMIVRLVDLFWLIAPEFHREGVWISWLDILLPTSLFAIWLGCFVWQLRGRAILPLHDPEFDEALGRIIERAGERPRPAH
ncbi:MAG: hypothetical protein DMF92_06175 [Acidobacteria bacterium]|nr:MAG: hypothetical protein DMF92_06175 [Acidobacteriota bacterium]